uniref:Frizzled class receptor 7 n=1 Tax=Sander lucioperca TaxID=283035 RepID=A0A8D0CTP4_SANLU
MAAGRSVWITLAFTLFVPPSAAQHFPGGSAPGRGVCQPVSIPLCADIAYNRTIMPNLLGHGRQEDAGLEVHQFYPLVAVRCSPELRFFLCSVYAPVCTVLERAIPPCRALCERARRGCEPLMNTFGFQWPKTLRCRNFPVHGTGEICVGQNTTDTRSDTPDPSPGIEPPTDMTDPPFTCPPQLRVPPCLGHYFLGAADCGAPCDASAHGGLMDFGAAELKFLRRSVGVCSALSCVSSLFAVLSFLLEPRRFRYPERPVGFLSGCCFMVAAAYLAGFLLGDTAACITHQTSRPSSVKTVAQGTRMDLCTLLFVVVYFFGMASAAWWLILSLSCFLSAAMAWGSEAVEARAPCFHLLAWALPAVQTLAVLAAGQVDGDVLTGVCYVGVHSVTALRHFVLVPLLGYLCVGAALLLAGFASLFRIRAAVKRGGRDTERLERLMVRMGVFGVLYTVPAGALLACGLYEQALQPQWEGAWRRRTCRHFGVPCPVGTVMPAAPSFSVFVIKYLMSLSTGIGSGLWVCSGKTLQTWRRFYTRLREGGGETTV